MSDDWLRFDAWEFLIIPVVITAVLALMYAVKVLVERLGIGAEAQRKIIHVAVGLSSLLFPLVFSGPLPVFALIACAIALMLMLRQRNHRTSGLGSVLHSVERPSYGEIYLALSVAFLFFRSSDNWILYVLPLLVVSLSDSASAMVGTAYGRLRFKVDEGHKSIEGTAIFFGVTLICSMIALLLLSDAPRPNVVVLSFLIAAFCALVEADSWRGLDNVFVPIGAHLLLERHMDTAPMLLLLLAICFLLTTFAALRYGSRFGLNNQTTRAYVVLLFLILSVTAPVNAILPVCAILSHLFLRTRNPGSSSRPDLDFLATSTAVGLIWLLAGESIGLSAINLFNMTFAGVIVCCATLASKDENISRRWQWILGPIWVLVVGTTYWITMSNPVTSQWYSPIWHPVAISLLACLTVPWFAASWFQRWRAPKAFAIAMIVPVLLFLSDGVMT